MVMEASLGIWRIDIPYGEFPTCISKVAKKRKINSVQSFYLLTMSTHAGASFSAVNQMPLPLGYCVQSLTRLIRR